MTDNREKLLELLDTEIRDEQIRLDKRETTDPRAIKVLTDCRTEVATMDLSLLDKEWFHQLATDLNDATYTNRRGSDWDWAWAVAEELAEIQGVDISES